jgi:inorganic phosphate transporter, PiT family|tara:strand:+ start:247059 stop:248531 length:1473 start_codon:yes stop_codon:yes gene_type:complete
MKPTLDKDLSKVGQIEQASHSVSRSLLMPGLALVFIALCALVVSSIIHDTPGSLIIVIAAAIGAYMALNIGANDVANNVGPAVGSKALSMMGALAIAAICESAGALIAGGDVVGTVSKGIIDPAGLADANTFILLMMSALIAAALWINIATVFGAPVSTTHSIVGGVAGAGIAAAGVAAVNWPTMGQIAASWVISPLLGGIIAAGFLAFIKTAIIYQDDKIAAARRWVPLLVAVMVGAFSTYLATKGLKHLIEINLATASMIGVGMTVLTWLVARPLIKRQSRGMENRNKALRELFKLPLIFSAALLSFAHGANDVANAIGPLAAIVSTAQSGAVAAKVGIPLWVMAIGALGISFGLIMFGPKLIRMVGDQITKLNPMRAFCVALSAAITVIVASALGLPVSSTHIAVGAVFGVGFFREWYTANSKRRRDYIARNPRNPDRDEPAGGDQPRYRRLVRRHHFMTIIAAWVITVPAAGGLSAAIFLVFEMLG